MGLVCSAASLFAQALVMPSLKFTSNTVSLGQLPQGVQGLVIPGGGDIQSNTSENIATQLGVTLVELRFAPNQNRNNVLCPYQGTNNDATADGRPISASGECCGSCLRAVYLRCGLDSRPDSEWLYR